MLFNQKIQFSTKNVSPVLHFFHFLQFKKQTQYLEKHWNDSKNRKLIKIILKKIVILVWNFLDLLA